MPSCLIGSCKVIYPALPAVQEQHRATKRHMRVQRKREAELERLAGRLAARKHQGTPNRMQAGPQVDPQADSQAKSEDSHYKLKLKARGTVHEMGLSAGCGE